MKLHFALLRGVNLAGHKQVAMADLRRFLTELGFEEVGSLLQSGNVVFRCGPPSGARLERLLETEAERRLGLQTDFFVRTPAQMKAIVAGNPFPNWARRDPAHLAVMFLKTAPLPDRVQALQAAIQGPEQLRAAGTHLYATYPAGFARSRLNTALIDKTLATRATGRNWNTVLKLAALAEG